MDRKRKLTQSALSLNGGKSGFKVKQKLEKKKKVDQLAVTEEQEEKVVVVVEGSVVVERRKSKVQEETWYCKCPAVDPSFQA
jgi:hypothetical protein